MNIALTGTTALSAQLTRSDGGFGPTLDVEPGAYSDELRSALQAGLRGRAPPSGPDHAAS